MGRRRGGVISALVCASPQLGSAFSGQEMGSDRLGRGSGADGGSFFRRASLPAKVSAGRLRVVARQPGELSFRLLLFLRKSSSGSQPICDSDLVP